MKGNITLTWRFGLPSDQLLNLSIFMCVRLKLSMNEGGELRLVEPENQKTKQKAKNKTWSGAGSQSYFIFL